MKARKGGWAPVYSKGKLSYWRMDPCKQGKARKSGGKRKEKDQKSERTWLRNGDDDGDSTSDEDGWNEKYAEA